MEVRCTRCSHVIPTEPDQRLPPWCPGCGADLKDAKAVSPDVQDPATQDAAQQEWVANNLRERFSRHNFAVGLLLAAWGLFIGMKGQPTNLDKLLGTQPTLATVLTILQWVTLANGGLLCLSGLGVREQRPWGMFLAATSAFVSILAGGVFFAVFQHLGTFPGLENSVARVNFATSNLNMIIGLVDGVGLLVFLSLYRPPVALPGRTSPAPRQAAKG